tara:strand:+ start:122 stop:466 length:345 start_codon:yes stop_codon:yes gene_type:complete
MELDARMIITIGGMLASVITSFIVVRQKVAELEADVKETLAKLGKLDSRLDRNDTQTDLVAQRLKVIADMNSPSERDKLSRAFERVEVQVPLLDKRIARLEHMHNGKHPVIPND